MVLHDAIGGEIGGSVFGRPQRGRTTLSTADGVLTVDEVWLGDREEVRPRLLVAVGAVSRQFVDTLLALTTRWDLEMFE